MGIKFNSSNILSQVPQLVFEQYDLMFRVDERRELLISEIPTPNENGVLVENGESLDEIAIPEEIVNWLEKLILLQRELQEFKSDLAIDVSSTGLIITAGDQGFNVPSEVLAEVRTDFIGYLRRNIGFAPKRSRRGSADVNTPNDTLSAPSVVEGAPQEPDLDEGIYGADTEAA
jgi:hypothetical protein